MLEYRTAAVVLRTFDYGQSDRLVHLYTEQIGRVSAIAKGARRSRRRFPGTLEIFSRLEVHLVAPPRAQLMRLEGAVLVEPGEGLVQQLGRFAFASQLLEMLDRLTAEGEANPELFRFSAGVLMVLCEERPDRLLALLVLLKTLARLGYRPQLVACARCGRSLPERDRVGFDVAQGGAVCPDCASGEAPAVPVWLLAGLEAGIRTPLRQRGELGIPDRAVGQAERLLSRFLQFHVGFELRTANFLSQIRDLECLDGAGVHGDTAPASGSVAAGASTSPAGRA